MTVVPPTPAVTKPVSDPTDATAKVPLLHVPFEASLNVIVVHIGIFPVITPGGALTVTVVVALAPHPFE